MSEAKFRLTAPPIQVGTLIPEYFYFKDGGIYKNYRVVTKVTNALGCCLGRAEVAEHPATLIKSEAMENCYPWRF